MQYLGECAVTLTSPLITDMDGVTCSSVRYMITTGNNNSSKTFKSQRPRLFEIDYSPRSTVTDKWSVFSKTENTTPKTQVNVIIFLYKDIALNDVNVYIQKSTRKD